MARNNRIDKKSLLNAAIKALSEEEAALRDNMIDVGEQDEVCHLHSCEKVFLAHVVATGCSNANCPYVESLDDD